jgi:integrase
MAVAIGHGEKFDVSGPEPVLHTRDLLARLGQRQRQTGPLLVGFDFPIGLPRAYGAKTGFEDFRSALMAFGKGAWASWYEPAERPSEIRVHRPFYPARTGKKGDIAHYNELISKRRSAPNGALLSVIDAFQQSLDFKDLAKSIKRSYVQHIKRIEKEFGDLPTKALSDRRVRGEFLAWRDKVSSSSGRRQADYAWSVLARILSWALNRGLVDCNPCTNAGRLHKGNRRDKIWSEDDEASFLTKGPTHLHLPLILALWSGQRQADLLSLVWSAYDGKNIRLRQSKTGARVVIPAGAPLKAALDAAKFNRKSTHVLVNTEGHPWSADGFRCSWGKAQRKAGIVGLTFNDLRGTAVTRLALCGCSEAEIATLQGHSYPT